MVLTRPLTSKPF